MESQNHGDTALLISGKQTLLSASRVAEGMSLFYVCFIAAVAGFTGLSYLLFPELGALAHDVLTRPSGKWASQPWRLVITPVLTAMIGILIAQHLPYHVLTILLVVVLSILVLVVLKSAIAPAISAGVLPLVMSITSWWYPVSIAGDLAVLVALLAVWRKVHPRFRADSISSERTNVDDVLQSMPQAKEWIMPFVLFVAVTGLFAQLAGLRLILVPPLIVIAYEMFRHPEASPCATRPFSLPVACVLTAAGGLAASTWFGTGALAAGGSLAWSIAVLRVLAIQMPPALAIGLLPLVLDSPDMKYPMSVALGTGILMGLFLFWRWGRRRS